MSACGTCLELLHPYLDRELSDEEVLSVKGHLHACPGCYQYFAFEMSVRRLVRIRLQEQCAPETLRERIVARLCEERTRYERQQARRGLSRPE